MSKLTLIFYSCSFITIIIFIVFSYLMTTVNPERIKDHDSEGNDTTRALETRDNTSNSSKDHAGKRAMLYSDDGTIFNDGRTAERVTVESIEMEKNGEKSNVSTARRSSFQTSPTGTPEAISVNASVESNLTEINRTTSPVKSSKGRRSIKEERKKKRGIVVLRVIGDEGKPRIEIVLYPKRSKGKKRRNYYNVEHKDSELIRNSILNILPDDTAILENGYYSFDRNLESDNVKSAKNPETAHPTENIFGLNNLYKSMDSHGITKLNSYFLPTTPTVAQNSPREQTFDIDTSQIKMNNNDQFKSDIITDEQPKWPMTNLKTFLFPIAPTTATIASIGVTLEINNSQTEINNSEIIKSDILVEETAPKTFPSTFLVPNNTIPDVINSSRDATSVITTIAMDHNEDQSEELKVTSDIITHDQTEHEQYMTQLNTTMLPTITEKALEEITLAIENTEMNTNYSEREEEEIKLDRTSEVNTHSYLHSIIPNSDIVSRSEIDIITDMTSNENASRDAEINVTSIDSSHVNTTLVKNE